MSMLDDPLLAAIRELPVAEFHNPHTVHALIHRIVLLKGETFGPLFDHERRHAAIVALVQKLIEADELEAAVGAARLASQLAQWNFINSANPFLKGKLLLEIVDRLLAQRHVARAMQLLDEACLLVDLIDAEEQGNAWVSLAPRYAEAGSMDRARAVFQQAIAWARKLESKPWCTDTHQLQPSDGSRLLERIELEMLRLGMREQAASPGIS